MAFRREGQTYSFALFFMTDEAVTYPTKSDGWAIGSRPSVVGMDKGAAANMTCVYAFPFGQKGLMLVLGLEGSKIDRINLGK